MGSGFVAWQTTTPFPLSDILASSSKAKEFTLFSRGTQFTDDSVMTIAVADALIGIGNATDNEIKDYIISEFGYDLSRTRDEIRPTYHHVETCQQTVPEAITAFLEGENLEDVIRTAVSLGGDCDTLTCIAGGMAEAFYGVPDDMKAECRKRLPEDMLTVLDRFEEKLGEAQRRL